MLMVVCMEAGGISSVSTSGASYSSIIQSLLILQTAAS